MRKHALFASVGAVALALSAPAFATGDGGGGGGGDVETSFSEDVEIDIEYDNELDTSIEVESDFEKDIEIEGEVELDGEINVEAAAVSISDPKQLLEDNEVFELGLLPGPDDNTVAGFTVNVDGNAGVNVAAGTFNMQANVATISTAVYESSGEEDEESQRSGFNWPPNGGGGGGGGGDDDDNPAGGLAEASTTALQKVLNNRYAGGVTNNVTIDAVGGTGNIGVNAAAGTFNVQENILTLASVTDSSLAEASAGVLQVTMANGAVLGLTDNAVDLGTVSGAGNIGVNAASGVGNVQHNSLTIAAALNGS